MAAEQPAAPPRAISVLPVFFVPTGQPSPSPDQSKRIMRHLKWSQTRYRELLGQKTTFAIAEQKPRVYRSQRPLEFYRPQEKSAPQVVSELLADLNDNRFNCPFILLVVMMNPKDDFPTPGGRPLNGGYNTGGGIIVASSFTLDHSPYFQSTLQHELGHAFGLQHVDVYGYDMKTNASMMSYDPRHHTKGFTESRRPGKFIPEDRRGLALNTRAFPTFHFDPEKDIPRGYSIAKRIVTFAPMKIPGQPDGPLITTHSGEEYGSKVGNIVQGRIAENEKGEKVTFDARTMWHSAKTATGWVAVQIAFPYEVELTRIVVHSQHSGQYHIAKTVRVAVGDNSEHLRPVVDKNLDSADSAVSFPTTKGRVWQLDLRADETGEVTLRGLQFFSGEDELFPPLVPTGDRQPRI
jgi:hypothetical protein